MRAIFVKRALTVILLDIVAGAAFAQFVWIDSNGTRQYSDQPPPTSIPKKNVLQQPAMELRNQQSHSAVVTTGDKANNVESAPEPDAAGNIKPPRASKEPLTTAQKNMEFAKRQSEQADKDKKAAENAKNLAAKAKNCERAQSYAQSLQSGERISSTDRNGEKSYISDDKREQELSDARHILESCK